jgi:protein arginine kinase activator
MLAAMHRGTQHAGKIPEYLRKLIENAVLVKDLKEQLEAAIRAEKFEEAASLRDRIRENDNAAG